MLESILAEHVPLKAAAMNWLGDVDTWVPPTSADNSESQWIDRYALVVFYLSTGGANCWLLCLEQMRLPCALSVLNLNLPLKSASNFLNLPLNNLPLKNLPLFFKICL
jgi:hypothetical protein